MVDQAPKYRKMVALISVIVWTHVRIPPDMIPGSIRRAVTLAKLFNGDTPKLIDASSTAGSIWCRMAEPARTEYGRRRMKYASNRIMKVPVRTRGGLLKATMKATPITVPGMAYGTITHESSAAVVADRRRTTRYAMSVPRRTSSTVERLERRKLLAIARGTLNRTSR